MKILFAILGVIIIALVFSYSRVLGALLLIISVFGLLYQAQKKGMI
jgi:hypothetical protein